MANKTKKVTTKTPVVKATDSAVVSDFSQTNYDLVIATLIVSVLVNLFVLIGWVALQVTSVYDAEVATFLFTR